jgi:hypothetical protein
MQVASRTGSFLGVVDLGFVGWAEQEEDVHEEWISLGCPMG